MYLIRIVDPRRVWLDQDGKRISTGTRSGQEFFGECQADPLGVRDAQEARFWVPELQVQLIANIYAIKYRSSLMRGPW